MGNRISLTEYALVQMYTNMRLAERKAAECDRDYGYVSPDIHRTLEAQYTSLVEKTKMYASVFMAAETAGNSPKKNNYQEVIDHLEAVWADKEIPRQRQP